MVIKSKVNLDYILAFFLFAGIWSSFSEHLTTIKTISAIAGYVFIVYFLAVKKYFPRFDKSIFLLVLAFFVSLTISALFSADPLYSFKWIKKTYWVPLSLVGIFLFIRDKNLKIKTVLLAFIFTFFINNFYFFYKTIQVSHTVNIFSPKFIPDRNYSFYVPIFLPFALAGIIYFSNMLLRIVILVEITFGLILLVLTGARGAYLSCMLEIILFILFVVHFLYKRYFLKYERQTIIKLIAIPLLVMLIGFAALLNHPKVKAAFHRGLSPNGRDQIIADRFPVIFKHHPILGLGYGRQLYFRFLEEHNVPKRFGHYDKKEGRYVYHSDEGIYLQTIIRQGLLGFFVFIPLFVLSLKRSFVLSFRKSYDLNIKVFYFSLFLVMFCHYFLRGFIETLDLGGFILFTLFISEKIWDYG